MNLISCDGCGIVFDKAKLNFPYWIWDEVHEEYDKSKCEYIYDPLKGEKRFIPFITCFACGERIYDFDREE